MSKPYVVKVPDIGEGIAEVELVGWSVKPGDTVAEDQPLAALMTDKATVEVPSPVAGTVLALGGEVGQMLAVGAELLRIGAAGAQPAAGAAAPARRAAAAPEPKPAASAAAAPKPAAGAQAGAAAGAAAKPSASVEAATAAGARPIASPALRARAWELGVDLRQVEGTGTAGRIVQADLDAFAARQAATRSPAAAPPASAPPAARAAPAATREVKIIGLRRRIAERMQQSKRRIPHYSYVEEVDVGEVEALRARLNADARPGERPHLTLLAFIARAIVLAAGANPQINARFDDEAGVLTIHDAVHLGVATSTEAGLMVPVLHDAGRLDLWSCAAGIARLAEGARRGTLTRAELAGSTITVSSLGRLGGIAATPVINAPEVAIVGVNRIVARPVVRDGAVVVRPTMNLSSSFDHRIVDGALAAAFVQDLRERLEHPALLFVPPPA